jgi:ribonuclease PH
MKRHDGRAEDALRAVRFEPGFLKHPAGSVLISMGDTRVLCSATVESRVPSFLNGSGEGWVTGEYAMLPAATNTRSSREVNKGRPSGRTLEIQRLIGRALRCAVDRRALGEKTIWLDCDVIQADGGTRTASITGAWVALALALGKLHGEGGLKNPVLLDGIAAISVGVVENRPVLDLDYIEDSAADVDMNVVRTAGGKYVEIQGTAEAATFGRDRMNAMLDLADHGIDRLIARQRAVVAEVAGEDALAAIQVTS